MTNIFHLITLQSTRNSSASTSIRFYNKISITKLVNVTTLIITRRSD